MSLAAPTALALARALLIAAVAVAISGPLRTWLAAQRGRVRTLAWALLLAPFFAPALLISYAFSKFALALIVAPASHEALYVSMLALKLVPVAVVVRMLLPSALSPEARHSYQLLAIASWKTRALFRLRGTGPGPWIAGGLVFLLAFADFELASLWNVRTWTVAIFDAQIGGLALPETLRLAAWPLAVQVAALALIGAQASRLRSHPRILRAVAETAGWKPGFRAPWLYLALSAGGAALLPLAIGATQALTGWRVLAEHFVLSREIGASALFALTAALTASVLARLGRKHFAALVLLGVPGLLGALIVSLLVLALFQLPPLRPAYDTPLPLLLALTVLLLPLALLLGALRRRPTPALHIARQVASRRLIWELETRPHLTALGLLFCWAWFDFTASSILAPVGFTPVFVRLHNLAHYGQTAVLSAMMLAAFVVPVLAVLLAGAGARWLVVERK